MLTDQGVGGLHEGVAFGGLFPVAEQTHARLLHAQDPVAVFTAQLGELGQPFRPAVDLGTGVNQKGPPGA